MSDMWTRPFHGVTHKGNLGETRLTVVDYGSFAVLKCWYKGCGFNPIESQHENVSVAKTVGEVWLSQQRN